MASEPGDKPTAITREIAQLGRALVGRERERQAELEAKLAELDEWMQEAQRIQALITGGAARREARMRALEQAVEAIAAERTRTITPRPLDLPRRNRYDASVVDMQSAEPTPGD